MIQNHRIARSYRSVAVIFLAALLASCGPHASSPAQSPSAYGNGALAWMEAHSVFGSRVNWTRMRLDMRAAIHEATSTTDTYPTIQLGIRRLRDGFFLKRNQLAHPIDVGFRALYPGGLVVDIEPNSPASRSGLRIGDVITRVNGSPPTSYGNLPGLAADKPVAYHLVLRRDGQSKSIGLTFHLSPGPAWQQCIGMPRGHTIRTARAVVGYVDLPVDCNTSNYSTVGQGLMRTADRDGACGWIIDLRQTEGGDISTYLATIGPILGQGKVGGLSYADGHRDTWTYRNDAVYWNGQKRESQIAGAVYRAKRPMAPVAVLLSRDTEAAGEMTVVALHGRLHTRSFGEPTAGHPTLTVSTPLSDGAALAVSAAFSFDRTARTFTGRLTPTTRTRTDWAQFGTEKDPTMRAALRWLQHQSLCAAS